MSDTLEVFGTEYTNVAGFKATDDNDTIKTYIRPQGAKSITANGNNIDVAAYATANVNVSATETVFVITLSWDSQENMYMPDCTYAQAYAAYQAGKTVAFECDEDDGYAPYYGVYSEDDSCFVYGVLKSFDSSSPSYHWGYQTYGYFWTSEGVELDDSQTIYSMDGATATAAEIASGSYAFISSGLATGTATRRDSTSLSASGATVSVPAGYYESAASKSVASGTAGTPTATKGAVSNHAVSVTPSVTNTAGYISGGTETGTAVNVSASELVSGTYTVSSSGTKDVTNYASASVPAGTEGTPTATKGAVSNHSVDVTPSVTNTTGYITGGTKTGTSVTVTASELASGDKAITSNGNNIDVVGYETVSVNVSGGGSSMNVQVAAGVNRVNTTTYSAVSGQSLTVATTGTYDVYWTGYRSSTSGTNGTQLYIDNAAYGTAQTTFSNNGQAVHLTGVSLTKDQVITLRARARTTSYYMYGGNLTIVQTA